MTQYVNPSTRHNGAKHIVVPRRAFSEEFGEPPFDGEQYVRQDGYWAQLVLPEFPEAPIDGEQYVRQNGAWEPIAFPEPDLFPKPITFLAINGSTNVTSGSWVSVGLSKGLTLARAVMMLATLKGLPNGGASTFVRARLSWSGDTVGNSYALFGNNWTGCISGAANTSRDDASVTFPLVVNSGSTTFQIQAIRESGTATSSLADTSFTLTPVGWADHYEA